MYSKSKNHNENYLATIVKLQNVRKHSNADRLQCVAICGNNVITGLSAKEDDLYVYFPLECAISADFLKYTNSFRDNTLNADPLQKGMFEGNCRVKAVRLRGEKSEGYIVPVSEIEKFCKQFLSKEIKITEKDVGTDFDEICNHLLCKKYVPRNMVENVPSGNKPKGNTKKYKSKLIENQFHFHPDTSHLKKEVEKIDPEDYIAITDKIHGCNFVVSNVLINRNLTWKDKVAKFLGFKIQETEYGMLYSSRKVLKNRLMEGQQQHNHYYDADVWKIVADKIFPSLNKGISVTGEIVGYTPNGKAIQKNYDYGCASNTCDFYVFNVTYTSSCGTVYTFSHPELEAFCHKFGFKTPKTFYYGKAKNLFPDLSVHNHWHQDFLDKMISTYLEKKCTICKNDVWAEGIVLRKMVPFEWQAFKLKSFNFLLKESEQLDSGEVDMDTAESTSE